MMKKDKKYCKHCGGIIDIDCVVCPKCGKQVEELKTNQSDTPIIINYSSSASAASSASARMDKTDDYLKKIELLLLDDSLDKLKLAQCNLDKLSYYYRMNLQEEVQTLDDAIKSVNSLLFKLEHLKSSHPINITLNCLFEERIVDLDPTAKPPIPKDLEQTVKDKQDECE